MKDYVSEGAIAFSAGVVVGFVGVAFWHWGWLGMLGFLAIYWLTTVMATLWLARWRRKQQEADNAEA